MANRWILFRWVASLAIGAVLGFGASHPAGAQSFPAIQVPTQEAVEDPPDRVGRLSRVIGAVSFQTKDGSSWSRAERNFPVAPDTRYRTGQGAAVDMDFGMHRVALAPDTEVAIDSLDGRGLGVTLRNGEIYVRLGDIGLEHWSVQTPRGLVSLGGPGRYAVNAGEGAGAIWVTTIEGQAEIAGDGVDLRAGPGQSIVATRQGGEVVVAAPDAFVTSHMRAEQQGVRPYVAPPPHVAELPGGSELAQFGQWGETPDYGTVWYPPVTPAWLPYRHGHWASVAPWGWTWVDDAPWGFAPSHYGRWAEIDGRWAWVSGFAVTPYAPALVAFFGAGVAIAHRRADDWPRGNAVGWYPLRPRETFRPWFGTTARYRQAVNAGAVAGDPSGLANRRGTTIVPARAMTSSRQMRSWAQPVTQTGLADATPGLGRPLLPPIQRMEPHRPDWPRAGQGPLQPTVITPRTAPGNIAPPRPIAPPSSSQPLPRVERPSVPMPIVPHVFAAPRMEHRPQIAPRAIEPRSVPHAAPLQVFPARPSPAPAHRERRPGER
jgi:hypothetical protein